ncbi:MAG: CoA transferase [Dehalococcoidia bacterium]|nr:CoA transferase [Dehalococcoidia bacterium]
MAAPLDGIKVLEVANWLAGPSCAALLADLGADVVKVEPPQGDAYRHLLMLAAGYQYDFEACYGFELDNRGKRSVTLDLDRPDAQDVLLRLAGWADIVITNLVPERRAKYGFSVDAVHAANPRAIYASVTGYGSTGDDQDRPGWDITSFWARSGIMSVIGEPDAPPPTCRGGQGDHTTGLNLLAAILVALRVRDQTGEGQFVDVTLQRTGLWTIGLDVQSSIISHEQPRRKSRKQPTSPITNTYLCSDGRWIFIMMPTPEYWPRFCTLLGRDDWLADERFATPYGRRDHSAELTAAVSEAFASKPYAEWARILDEARMIFAPVQNITDAIEDPQLRAIGAFTKIEHPQLGTFETLDTPFTVRGADIGARGPAPAIGEHTFTVLEDIGLTPDEIATHAANGAFG